MTVPITATRIKARREQLGFTQAELADFIGKTQKQIWIYENGKGFPSVEGLISLAATLQTTTDWLLGLTDEIKPFKNVSDLTDAEKEMIRIMRSKTAESQKKLIDIARVV